MPYYHRGNPRFTLYLILGMKARLHTPIFNSNSNVFL